MPTRTETIAAAITKGKTELAAMVADGTMHEGVESFSDVHDHVDANGIGGCFGIWADSANIEEGADDVNAVFAGLDAWIKTGALRAPA